MSILEKLTYAATLGLLVAGCGSKSPAEPAPSNGSPVGVTADTARETSIPVLYEATGTVKARFNAVLSSKVMARVGSVNVQEGDSVRKGQVLVGLDGRELDAGVQMAQANLSASVVGVDNARTAREMETKTSSARIAQAEAAVQQSRAALSGAQSRLDLALAGPRTQERTQAHLAVVQAESTLKLAKTQLDRISGLVAAGAMPKKNLDEAQNSYDLAVAQRDTAVQSEKISQEGTRAEDIRAARDAVTQAQAAVKQAQANLSQARAAALQAKVRGEEIRVAQAQVSQSAAALRSAEVLRAYGTITAPFDGKVVQRTVDPGAMATPGSPLMTIEGGELRLEAVVPESVLMNVSKGATMTVRVDALARDFDATVSEIMPQGDAASHSFVVKLALPSAGLIHSGMFGRAFIPTGSKKTIEIPTQATWEREGLRYVYVINAEGLARLRIVTLGQTRGDRVAVLSGLSPGERIITSGRDGVTDGSKVTSR